MKYLSLYLLIVCLIPLARAELPESGFRAVSGGASPDGRWIISVLDSSGVEFTDQLPDEHHAPYVLDLHTMKAASRITSVSTLGGLHGRPETNVTAKWFPDSKFVSIGWSTGRLNNSFALFQLTEFGELVEVSLPDPMLIKTSIFSKLLGGSNSGSYLESIQANGDLVVVYYGFLPKDAKTFFATDEGKRFDFNRVEVIYSLLDEKWEIKTIESPGSMKDKKR